MGRHSSPERSPFLRSLVGWALPWFLIALVLAIALVVVFDVVGNDPVRTAGDEAAEVVGAPAEDSPSEEPDGGDGRPDKAEEDEGSQNDDDGDEGKGDKSSLVTKDVMIQVLNGTADPNVDDVVADRLARLGFTVVAVSPASIGYDETVVFWTEGAAEVGRPLADRFGWGLEPAPSNLSSEVHLHVVVGEDSL